MNEERREGRKGGKISNEGRSVGRNGATSKER
jgi:hypothetical protein